MKWRKLLLPFSGLYWLGTAVRNVCYNTGLMRTTSFNLPMINVGNLSVGGTGKSPHVMYLIDLLKNERLVCTLSRGYGRKTKGFKVANYESKVYDIGDEPLQFFRRFKNRILIAVCEDRVYGVEKILKNFFPGIIILDDAFQHRRIKAGLNILLTDFNHPYYKDYPLPAGDLREGRGGARRADIIIVTKCPDTISSQKQEELMKRINLKSHQSLFFSKVVYDDLIINQFDTMSREKWLETNVVLVTGIAKPQPLVDFVTANFAHVLHLEYPDHHNFKDTEIDYISKRFIDTEGKKIILTTEKDYMRLLEEASLKQDLYYLPIRVELNDKEKFNQTILDYVRKN